MVFDYLFVELPTAFAEENACFNRIATALHVTPPPYPPIALSPPLFACCEPLGLLILLSDSQVRAAAWTPWSSL